MGILLDTQALIWSLEDPDKLSDNAHNPIINADNVFVSAVSFHEIAIKISIGKDVGINIPLHIILEETFLANFIRLPVTTHHITSCLDIPLYDHHRDPFDRMLLAIALADGLSIVSSDRNFPLYNGLVTTIW